MNPRFRHPVHHPVRHGYGLWLWLGLRIALGPRAWDFEPIGWFFALLLGAALTSIGIVALALALLGKLLRVWRRVLAMAHRGCRGEGDGGRHARRQPVVLMVAPLPVPHELVLRLLAALFRAVRSAMVCSERAMIYASLKPIPRVAAAAGAAGTSVSRCSPAASPSRAAATDRRCCASFRCRSAVLAIAMAILKLGLLARDRCVADYLQTRGDAIGLPNRKPSVFETPAYRRRII